VAKKRDSLADARACFSFALRKAARSVARRYDAALRPTGLRNTQFNLLVVLDATGPISVGALATVMSIERTTLTRNLARVVRAGFVRVERGPDRRSRTLILTSQGRAAALRALPAWRAAQAEVRRSLGAKSFDALVTRLAGIKNV
jgi:DNA-binding MarR family transcriptional regulator